MKVLVVGLGSIGRRHIKNIKFIDKDIQIAVWRQFSKEANLGDVVSLVEKVFFSKTDSLKWNPDIVFITNPATMHAETALTFAKHNCHLFIEKPLSVNQDYLDELIEEVDKRSLIALVGYVLRFSNPIRIMKEAIDKGCIGKPLSIRVSVGQNLLSWRPDRNYQETVSGRSDLGGGVCFELSHEIDYARWLMGEVKDVYALVSKVSNLDIDVEDVADILLKFKSEAVGNIHLDMIDYAKDRSCRIIGDKGTLIWNASDNNRVQIFSLEKGNWQNLYESSKEDRNSSCVVEIKHFFDCIANKKEPLISLREARKVLQVLIEIKNSVKNQKAVSV